MVKIEIIAVGQDAIYSVYRIEVNKKGEVYIINPSLKSHTSRHVSGDVHWRLPNGTKMSIRKGPSLQDFKGCEFLGTYAFGLGSLPLFTEYKLKKCDGICAIDMRAYKESAFNMSIAILTEEGMSTLYSSWKTFRKKQAYLYMDSHPMIAIMCYDARQRA